MDNAYKIIVGKLKAGELPPEFLEEHRIVNIDQDSAQAVSRYTRQILDRLLRARGIDPVSVPVRFLLINEDQPNAFMISVANPPIMGISKGLLAQLKYEDQLAGVERHEFQHNNLAAYRNTKTQEWLADESSVDDLQSAGYNPQGLTEVLRILPNEGTHKSFYYYFDEHPDTNLRIRELENHNVIKARKEGDLNSDWIILDTAVQSITQTATTPPRYIERLLAEAGFDDLPQVQRIQLMTKIFEQEFTKHDHYFHSRVEDFRDAILKLDYDETVPTQKEAFDQFVDRFLTSPHKIVNENQTTEAQMDWRSNVDDYFFDAAIQVATKKKVDFKLARPPVGRMKELNQYIAQFVAATTADEAERCAIVINNLASRYDFRRSQMASTIAFAGFPEIDYYVVKDAIANGMDSEENLLEKHSREKLEVPWTAHVAWSNQATAPHIRHALQRLDIGEDRRLAPLPSEERNQIQSIMRRKVVPWHTGKTLSDLRFSDTGLIIGAGENFEQAIKDPVAAGLSAEEYMATETKRLFQRAEAEQRLLVTIDWSELKKDFKGFVTQYQKYLIPENSVVVVAPYPFAAEFISRVDQLLTDDPATYRRLVYNFMLTHSYSEISVKRIFNERRDGQKEGFLYDQPIGMGPDHPYMHFVLEDKFELFSAKDKSQFAQLAAYRKTEKITQNEEEKFAISPRDVYGKISENPPDDFIDLTVFYTHLLFMEPLAYGSPYNRHVLAARLHDVLTKNNGASFVLPEDMHVLRSIAKSVANEMYPETQALMEQMNEYQAQYDLRPKVKAQKVAEIYTLYVAGDNFANNPLLRRRYEAAIIEKAAAINDPQEREKLAQTLLYAQKIRTFLPEEADFGWVSSDPFTKNQYTGQLHSHDFRDWAIQLYVDSLKNRLGIDDGSDAYCERVKDLLGNVDTQTTINVELLDGQICTRVSNSVLSEMLPALAKEINAQPNTAFLMRDIWKNRNLAVAMDLGYLGGGVELSIDIIAQDPVFRLETIDFLTTPITPERARIYGQAMHRAIHGNSDVALRARDSLRTLGLDGDWSDATCIDVASTLHENFRRAPPEGKGWYLDKVLFPPGQNDEQAFKDAMQLVLNKTFPGTSSTSEYAEVVSKARKKRRSEQWYEKREQLATEKALLKRKLIILQAGSAEEKRTRNLLRIANLHSRIEEFKCNSSFIADGVSDIIENRWNRFFGCSSAEILTEQNKRDQHEGLFLRQVVESYIEEVPVPEQRLLLTALIAARDTSQEQEQATGKPVRIGQFAKQVLIHMNEIGGKLLQSINSHRDVSDEIRRDTKDTKSDYQPAIRWDLLSWSQEYGIKAQSPEEEVVYYGPAVASGSMGVTMFNQTANSNIYAETILRPHAQSRSAREARIMVGASKRLAKKNPLMNVAVDIAQVAERDARIETRMSLSSKQGIIAKQVYSGLQTWATVNGKQYHLNHETADVIAYSEGVKRARVVKGVEFNKLPEDTQEQRDLKEATAIQLYGTEILNILTRMPRERDRHGSNQLIDAETVGHIDFGMMDLEVASDEQIRELTRAILHAARDHIILHKDFSAALDEYTERNYLSEDIKRYLSETKRQMLALGDIEKYVSDSNKKAILGAIFSSKKVDPVILEEMRQQLTGPVKLAAVSYLTHYTKKHPVFRFDDSHRANPILMPELTEEERAVINGDNKNAARAKSRVVPISESHDDSGHEGPIRRQLTRMSVATLKRFGIRAA